MSWGRLNNLKKNNYIYIYDVRLPKGGRVGWVNTAQIVSNLPNRVRAGLRACKTHHYLVRALRP